MKLVFCDVSAPVRTAFVQILKVLDVLKTVVTVLTLASAFIVRYWFPGWFTSLMKCALITLKCPIRLFSLSKLLVELCAALPYYLHRDLAFHYSRCPPV